MRSHRNRRVWRNMQFCTFGLKSVVPGRLYFLNLNYILNLIGVFGLHLKSLVPGRLVKFNSIICQSRPTNKKISYSLIRHYFIELQVALCTLFRGQCRAFLYVTENF